MAIYGFGVVYGDIQVPGHDTSTVTSSSEPLSQGDLTQAIEDGASQINTLLDRSGITPQTVAAGFDEDTHGMCVTAIKAFAKAEALRIIGDSSPRFDAAWGQWLGMLSTISSRPQNLGDEYVDGLTCEIDDITSGAGVDPVAHGEFDFFNTKLF